jgi:hypothetical protein
MRRDKAAFQPGDPEPVPFLDPGELPRVEARAAVSSAPKVLESREKYPRQRLNPIMFLSCTRRKFNDMCLMIALRVARAELAKSSAMDKRQKRCPRRGGAKEEEAAESRCQAVPATRTIEWKSDAVLLGSQEGGCNEKHVIRWALETVD